MQAMGLTIIFNWKKPTKRIRRSSQEEELRGAGWGRTMDDEQLDKTKFLEKKVKEETGLTKNFFHLKDIDSIK
jgi:hypothetical protein